MRARLDGLVLQKEKGHDLRRPHSRLSVGDVRGGVRPRLGEQILSEPRQWRSPAPTLGSRDKHPLPRGMSKALADPLVQALMAVGGVDRSSVEALMRRMAERLARRER